MPIRREVRWVYPTDWRELSIAIRFKRAQGCCEHCGRPHGKTVAHLGDGRWWDEERQAWRCDKGRAVRRLLAPVADGVPKKTMRVVLATAHLNTTRAMTVRPTFAPCFNAAIFLHDKEEHRIRRRLTYRARKALGDLFTGPYPS